LPLLFEPFLVPEVIIGLKKLDQHRAQPLLPPAYRDPADARHLAVIVGERDAVVAPRCEQQQAICPKFFGRKVQSVAQ